MSRPEHYHGYGDDQDRYRRDVHELDGNTTPESRVVVRGETDWLGAD